MAIFKLCLCLRCEYRNLLSKQGYACTNVLIAKERLLAFWISFFIFIRIMKSAHTVEVNGQCPNIGISISYFSF